MIPLLVLLAAMQDAGPAASASADQTIVVQGVAACGPRYARVYFAPMGEPFRTDGSRDPMKAWFDQADADHDGRVTLAELDADSDRYFATLDLDHSGELDPEEVARYENVIAPELKLYQPGQDRRPHTRQQKHDAKAAARQRADYEAPYGAGLYASLNIPEPIASADYDLNRGISQDELHRAATHRWPMLDPAGHGFLTYDSLPKSPAQQDIDACRAAADKKRR